MGGDRRRDEFRSLLFLQVEFLNLVHWKADETNFPKLRELFVCDCYKLEEIPSAIGDIPTLQEIEIYDCGASIVASAKQILKVQQEEYDNFDLQKVNMHVPFVTTLFVPYYSFPPYIVGIFILFITTCDVCRLYGVTIRIFSTKRKTHSLFVLKSPKLCSTST